MTRKQYKLTRRLMLVLAAAPLFQFTECKTVASQTGQLILNQLPSTLFSMVQSIALAPLYSLLGGGASFNGGGLGNNNGGFGGGGI